MWEKVSMKIAFHNVCCLSYLPRSYCLVCLAVIFSILNTSLYYLKLSNDYLSYQVCYYVILYSRIYSYYHYTKAAYGQALMSNPFLPQRLKGDPQRESILVVEKQILRPFLKKLKLFSIKLVTICSYVSFSAH